MNKILLILILLSFIIGCSSPLKKDINTLIGSKIENIDTDDMLFQEIIITQKIHYFFYPLFLSLFISIILIFSGIRAIGLSILISSITCIVLIILLSLYMKIIAFIGLIILLIGIYFLGKSLYYKSMIQKDLINSVTIAKNFISIEDKKILSKNLNKIQSKETKIKVQEIKNNK